MKYKWIDNKENDARRLLNGFSNTANNFYQDKKFLVVPEPIDGNPKSVYMPRLEIHKIKDLWERSIASHDDTQVYDSLLSDILKITPDKDPKTKAQIAKRKAEFDKLIPKLESITNSVYANRSDLEDLIVEIRPSIYNTSTTFCYHNNTATIFYRVDLPVSYIIYGLMSCLVMSNLPKGERWQGKNWETWQAISDYMFSNTAFSSLIDEEYLMTQASLENSENLEKVIRLSNNYLEELGFAPKSFLKLDNDKILVKSKLPSPDFTPREEKVLKHLIANRLTTVDFDTVGNLIWGDESSDKFSLWAISKYIERIRKKIVANGISANLLITRRGKGYLLLD